MGGERRGVTRSDETGVDYYLTAAEAARRGSGTTSGRVWNLDKSFGPGAVG